MSPARNNNSNHSSSSAGCNDDDVVTQAVEVALKPPAVGTTTKTTTMSSTKGIPILPDDDRYSPAPPTSPTHHAASSHTTLPAVSNTTTATRVQQQQQQQHVVRSPHISKSAASDHAAGTNGSSSVAQQQECDYDLSPTELYQAIEAKQWDWILETFESSTHVHVQQQAAVWVVRKELSGKLRWRLLPIHAAIIFEAPAAVVDCLLAEHPTGCASKDDQGMLPLHLALRNRPVNWVIAEELLTAHPAAVFVKDRKGRTPVVSGLAALHSAEPELSAPLRALQLYTNIVTASERTVWLQDVRAAAEQRLQETQQRHIVRLTELRNEFERDQDARQAAADRQLQQVQRDLQAATHREKVLEAQLQVLSRQFHEQSAEQFQHRESQLQQENESLKAAVQVMLDQQNSFQLELDKLQWEQSELNEKRIQLMRQFKVVDEKMIQDSQAAFSAWRGQLRETGQAVQEQMADLLAGYHHHHQPIQMQQEVTANDDEDDEGDDDDVKRQECVVATDDAEEKKQDDNDNNNDNHDDDDDRVAQIRHAASEIASKGEEATPATTPVVVGTDDDDDPSEEGMRLDPIIAAGQVNDSDDDDDEDRVTMSRTPKQSNIKRLLPPPAAEQEANRDP